MKSGNIICMSSIDWDFNWQGHQEVMSALAAEGNRVLFVENTGVRAVRFSDLPRLRRRLLNWWKGTKGFRQEQQNLYVYSPVVLPFPHSRLARWVNRTMLVRALKRWGRATHFGRPTIWTFLPTRLVVDLIDRLDPQLVVYYCIADFDQLTSHPRALARSERMLLDRADVVFVQGEALRQRCLPHPNIHIFPFGVNVSVFSTNVAVSPEVSKLKHPVVGYVGGLHRHVDLDLMERIACEIDGTLLLVGPVQVDASRLERLPNVVFAGPQPHECVPGFVKGFDVGIVPYVQTEYTRTVFPTKMNEYLAMEVPVVTTDLPEIRAFAEVHGGAVDVAPSAEAFVESVRAAIDGRSSTDARSRVSAAHQHSWSGRIAEMSTLVDAALKVREDTEERWDVLLKRYYRTARRRALQVTATVVAVYLLLFYSPALWVAAQPLLVPASPQRADAIIVFGGGVGESGRANNSSYQDRVQEAVALYEGGFARNVVFSSGFTYLFQEAQVMKALAVSLGVPAADIVLETRAGNTQEYVLSVRNIAEREGWHRVLLVSSPYHMRRATLTWRKLAPEIAVVSTPATQSQYYAHGFGASLEQIRGIAQEYAALVYYWSKGWI
jgi:uncharacterized SAM-binding protein YcdF (DUF218 family)/glycosyltransferase involved in cell wall biosynthesis